MPSKKLGSGPGRRSAQISPKPPLDPKWTLFLGAIFCCFWQGRRLSCWNDNILVWLRGRAEVSEVFTLAAPQQYLSCELATNCRTKSNNCPFVSFVLTSQKSHPVLFWQFCWTFVVCFYQTLRIWMIKNNEVRQLLQWFETLLVTGQTHEVMRRARRREEFSSEDLTAWGHLGKPRPRAGAASSMRLKLQQALHPN